MKINTSTMQIGDFPFPLLRYDGVMMGELLQFTELDRSRPSYGTSFCVRAYGVTDKNVCEKRAAKVREFYGSGKEG